MRNIGMMTIAMRTFNKIQTLYFVPAVFQGWQNHQQALLEDCQGKELRLAGDARCCSPGHTAKFGSYSVMDMSTSKILDVQMVQVTETKNSYWMELQGLKRCLQFLGDKSMNVTHIITDRHSQIKKYLRETWPAIIHWFDVWHVAKGIRKKLDKLAKKKLCKSIGNWAASISNHIYWCAASSKGNAKLVLAKWLSVGRHVINKHRGHGAPFPRCLHKRLEDRDWMKEGSKAYLELMLVLKQPALIRDIGQLSPAEQTSSLESYHNICCHFAPKSVHFPYEGMKARLFLAAIHFNENSNRDQAVDKDGSERWSISYPKGRKGEPIAKEVKVPVTYSTFTCLFKAFESKPD
ncbi:uncharacterized protein LOC135501681 [Lineus longissimus]|uniref:uncharacterized protein LOC135501681 n=1 Tax=Lineus longissimus TaxID=88925 RepID=UPI00315D30F9